MAEYLPRRTGTEMSAHPAVSDTTFPTQTLGPYVLLERLGEGGMGEVFKARHAKLDRIVAIKLIRTDHLPTKSAVRRFVRELRAVARLDHPLIVRAFDAGSDDGKHYLAMEYVEGEDLSRTVASHGPLSVPEACRVVFQVTLALQHLHECGITHRDLKPTNLLRVRATGQVKVLDLGLARVAPESRDAGHSGTMTQVGTVLGTPDYMAPEQALDSTKTDIRSDLYSLGCAFFFFLTGQPPFAGGTSLAKMIRHHDEIPPSVAELRHGVPAEVAVIIAKLLAKRPEDRYQTPGELLQALLSPGSVPSSAAPAVGTVLPPEATEVLEGGPDGWRSQLSSALSQDSAQLSVPGRLAESLQPRPWRAIWTVSGVVLTLSVLLSILLLGARDKARTVTEFLEPDPAIKAAEDAKGRAEAFATYRLNLGTSRGVEAAERIRRLASPLDEIKRPRSEVPALILGQPGAFHVGPINHLSVSRDGKTIVSGGWDRTVRVWDAVTLKHKQTLTGHKDPIHSVAISHDGRRVLGASWFEAWHGGVGFERAIRVWEVESMQQLLHLHHDHFGWTLSGAFTGDGQLLAGKFDSLELWHVDRRERVWTKNDPGMDWQGVTILSADGNHVFTGGNYKNQVRVWEQESGKLLHRFDGHRDSIVSLAANPDNVRLASIGQDHNVRLWDYKAGKALQVIPIADGRPRGVSWSPDGSEIVVAVEDGSVRWYHPETGKELRRGNGHLGPLTAVASSAEAVFTAGEDGTIRKWNSQTGSEMLPARPVYPAVRIAFADDDRKLRVVPRFGKPITYTLPAGSVTGPSWTGVDVFPLALSANGNTVLGRTSDRKPVTGDLATGAVSPRDRWPDVGANAFALSPDGHRALAAEKVVDWTELGSGTLIHRLTGLEGEPTAATVSDDGRLGAVTSRTGAVAIWNLIDGKIVRLAAIPKGDARQLVFGPDGRRLFVFGPGDTAWELETAGSTEPVSWQPHDAPIRCAALAANDSRIATATDDGEIAIRTQGVARLRFLKAPSPVTALAFSVDSRLLAAALADGTIALYRVGP